MKKFYLFYLLMFISMVSVRLQAQTVIINTGTAGTPAYNAGPVYRSSTSSAYDASRYAYLYTQAELAAAGILPGSTITQLGWVKNNTATTTGGGIFRIFMKNSAATDYGLASETWSNLSSGTAMVYENLSQSIPATATPNYINFTLTGTPFIYTGGALEILTEWDINQVSGSPSTGTFDWLWSTVPDRIYGTGNTTLAGITTLSSTTNSISAITDRRPFIQITYTAGTACTNPPTTGTATSSVSGQVCPGTAVTLGLSGNSTGSGLTFEWESSVSNTPFSPTSISSPASSAGLTINPTSTLWYRAKLVCNSGTPVYSSAIQVLVGGGLPAGTYTINSGAATGGTNYNSFAAAISALNCGIAGPVVFNVVPGSGPYVETISMSNISGTSATNTVKFNGNGNTVQFDHTTTNRQLLTLSGTKYVKIDSLKFKTINATYGWAALITGGAAYDSITRCTFDLSSITTTTSGNSSGICFSASATAAATAGANGSNCYIGNNLIKGPSGTGGPYYGITVCGTSDNNVIRNNKLEDYYMYGIYIDDATGTVVTGNDIHRANKTSVTTFYGIYTTGVTAGTQIKSNRVHDAGGTAGGTSTAYHIYLAGDATAANPAVISNNAVYNTTMGGIIYGIYMTTPPHNKVYHNSIDISKVLTGTSANYGIYATGTNPGVVIKNNNVSITAGTDGTKYGFYYSAAASIDDAQHNNFYVNSSQSGTQNYGYYTAAYADIAAFQTAYPALEVGATNADPQFVNAATGNLMPANFVLYATGEDLTAVVPDDINGTLRSATPSPGAFEMPLPPINNAGTVAKIEPAGAVCPGVHPVSVSIVNAGQNTLNNVQIHWQVNGVTQPAITYTGPLTAATVVGGQNVDTVSLGSVTLTAATPTVIKVWTAQPNGVADTDHSNDTLSFTLITAMGGTYTINGSNPTGGSNYASFADFTADLLLKGVCSPVVADVNPASGPYVEAVSFGGINGVSAVNTIKVNGHGATVQFTNTTTNRQMLTLSGTRYLKLDSLNFKTLDATYGWAALITNGSAYDSITNCKFDLRSITTTTSGNSSGICFSGSATAATTAGVNGSHVYIGGNYLQGPTGTGGPYYGVTVSGASDSNVIERNLLENYYMYGIYVNDATGTLIRNNEAHRSTKTAVTTFYGIYTTGDVPGTRIIGNRVHSPGGTAAGGTSAVYAIYPSGDGTAAKRCLIANNLVYNINQGGTVYGIYGLSAVETDIVHNTISYDVVIPNTSTSTMYGIYVSGTSNNTNVRNNIVSITGGTGGTKYGFYYSTATAVTDAQGNDFYVNSTQGGTQNYGYLTAAYTTMADFQTDYPALENGSVSENPQFVNLAAGNLFPLNTNLYTNGMNTQVLVPADINGAARTTTPTPGAYEITAAQINNAGAYALINPTGVFCSGPRLVQASIINAGINPLTALQINWTVNGVAQSSVNYTGPLNGMYNLPNIDTVDLGTAFFPAGVPSVVKIWTSMPNGQPDAANANDTITVTVQPSYSVVVNLGNDTTICAQSSLTLNAGNSGATYLWSNGSTAQSTAVNTAGQHFVTVTAADGCIGSDTLQLTLTPLPVVNLGNDTAICPGTTLVLNAANPGATYVWDDGSTNQMRTVSLEATYTVAVTANGCTASDVINVSLVDVPVADGINAIYGDTATYTFNVVNPQFATTYTWNFGDGTPTATGMTVQHTYAHNGIYTVTLSMGGYCNGNTGTVQVTVDVFDAQGGGTGINDKQLSNEWLLYPNPAKGYLYVESKSGVAIEQAEVFTVTGQRVYRSGVASSRLQVLTRDWAPGIYLLKIGTAKGLVIRKFEILR